MSTETTKLPPRKLSEFTEISERKQGLVKDFFEKVWTPYSTGEKAEGDSGDKTYVWPPIFLNLSVDDQKIWCYKLMIARKFDIEEAKKMLQAILEFRQEFNTEYPRKYFPPPFEIKGYDMQALADFFQDGVLRDKNEDVDRTLKATRSWQSICFHKTSKWGHPVWYECFGRMHPHLVVMTLKQLTSVAKNESYLDVFLRYHVNMCETGIRLAQFQDATFGKKHNEKVSGIISICDMQGLGTHHWVNDFIAYLSLQGEFDKKVYPEFLHHVLVINAPSLIRAAFSVVSPLIDARTQTKISFHAPGDATLKALKEWISEGDIPSYLGGKCNCEGGCVHVPDYDKQEKEYQDLLKQMKEAGASGPGSPTTATNGLAQVGVEVPAGKSMTRELVVKKDDNVSWEWLSDAERTVEFSVSFEGDEPQSPVVFVVKPDKITKHDGNYKVEADGKVKIVFNNDFSWMRSKYLTLKTSHDPITAITIDGEEAAAETKKKDDDDDNKDEEQE